MPPETLHPKPDLNREWRLWWRLILVHHQPASASPRVCTCGNPVAACIFRVKAAEYGLT
ncbi:hypothetical protein [Phytomonospora endophytica]|uniref:Uncharacterized protein n=1 Tax=Phytomonospora endophytica TaxID=714109 RepID=A0A841FU43_9ACTN|nr:hypothetical protein [Phytomonospora endophytica]MBB6039865.1 hypothetical protein [Phytomonospora endophytica]GIG70279.1 hypothetical protein Pen01_65740 [Phytomonospora endophytica]